MLTAIAPEAAVPVKQRSNKTRHRIMPTSEGTFSGCRLFHRDNEELDFQAFGLDSFIAPQNEPGLFSPEHLVWRHEAQTETDADIGYFDAFS